jgi:hypothetical protein
MEMNKMNINKKRTLIKNMMSLRVRELNVFYTQKLKISDCSFLIRGDE